MIDEIRSRFVDDNKYCKPIDKKRCIMAIYNMTVKATKTKKLAPEGNLEEIRSHFSELINQLEK